MAGCKKVKSSRGRGLCGSKKSIFSVLGRGGRNRYKSTRPPAHNLQSSKPFKLAKSSKELKEEWRNTDSSTKNALKELGLAAGTKISSSLAGLAERKFLLPKAHHGKAHSLIRKATRATVVGLLKFFGDPENVKSTIDKTSKAYRAVQSEMEDKQTSGESTLAERKKYAESTSSIPTKKPVDREVSSYDAEREAKFQAMMAKANKPDPENERRYQEMLAIRKAEGEGYKKARKLIKFVAHKKSAKLMHKIARKYHRKLRGRNAIYSKHHG